MRTRVAARVDLPSRRVAGVPARAWLAVLLAFAALVVIRALADAPDLLSRGAVGASLRFTAPILLAGMGALWAERSGVINIGLEGAMITGTWFGAWAGYQYGPEAAIVAGLAAGAGFGLVQALLTVRFAIDQAVAGLSLNLLAAGVARFLSSVHFDGVETGTITQSPAVAGLATIAVPGAEAILGPVEAARIPFLSDAASLVLGLVTNLSPLTLAAFAVVPVTAFLLARTRLGLRIRFAGEAPDALDAAGVNPNRYRALALAVSGALGALGGVYLVLAAGLYSEGQTAGRGYIGMATVIFGNWQAGGTAAGSLLFGVTDALRTRQEVTVSALALAGALLLALLAVRALRHHRILPAALLAGAAVGVGAWFAGGGVVPTEFVAFAPQVTTLLVLAFARQELRPPAASGLPWRRDEAP